MMLAPLTTTPRAYQAALTATATADPWAGAQRNYPVPQRSLGCAEAMAAADAGQRYQVAPGVPEDHLLRDEGAPVYLTEREALAGLGGGRLDFVEPFVLPVLALLAWAALRR